jgi:hypothetical protein
VCADAHLHGFHFDTDPPLFEINCDCDGDRFMHLECAVGLGGTDVGNSWRQCPTCHGKYGDHTFANAVAEEAWATFKDATGPPGSGTMIDIQRLQAMYALAAVKLKEGHFDEATEPARPGMRAACGGRPAHQQPQPHSCVEIENGFRQRE